MAKKFFAPGDLFVSPRGDDRWSGTRPEPEKDGSDGPLATVNKAQVILRRRKETAQAGSPVTVWIRGGTYHLDKPLVFTPEDSAPATYAAWPGEQPVFHGGRPITGWREETRDGKRLWTADLAGKLPERGFRQFFVNGERRTRARLPKEGYFWMKSVPGITAGGDPGPDLFAGSDTFRARPGDIQNWEQLEEAEVVVPHYWVGERMPIRSFDPENGLVKSSRRSIFALVDDTSGRYAKYYVENVKEALSGPGEWYLDRPEQKLYYLPREDERVDACEAVAPLTLQFVRFEGDPESGARVEHIRLKGLTFAYSDWIPPDHRGTRFDPYRAPGERTRQDAAQFRQMVPGVAYASAPQSAYDAPGVICLVGARCCSVEDCRLEHLGFYGLELAEGCSGNRLVGNTIRDAGAGGIKVDGAASVRDTARLTFNNRVTDNHIFDGGHVFLSAVGILLQHTFGNLVAHNHVHDLYYSGISCGWKWAHGEHVSRDNRIEKNHIHHLGKGVINDMGGIYILGNQPGTVIRGNLIHDIEKSNYGGSGIYLDASSSFLVVENNVCYRTSTEPFFQHFGRENTIRNNILAFGADSVVTLYKGNAYPPGFPHGEAVDYCAAAFYGNILVTDRQPVFHGLGGKTHRFTGNPLAEGGFYSDSNLFWDVSGVGVVCGDCPFRKPGRKNLSPGFEFAEWQALGFDTHSLVGDPGFADPENDDFTLPADSPAFRVGFKPIDISDVGPRAEGARS